MSRQSRQEKNPARYARGCKAFASYLATAPGVTDTDDDIMDALYYLDRQIVMPTGGRKAKALLRAESLKRGLQVL